MNIKILDKYMTYCKLYNIYPTFQGLKDYKLDYDMLQNIRNKKK